MSAIIWNTLGHIMHKCDSIEDAEDLIEACDYEELHRTYKNGDTNIVVVELG